MMSPRCLSKTEEEKIKNELKEAINTLIVGCETLDMELAFRIFSTSANFLMMGTDGTICDYQTYVNNNVNYLMTCTNFKLFTHKEEIRVLDHDMAIFSWAYRAEATLKTGEKDIFENAGASFVFRKVNDEWKVIYYHESSLPVIRA
jgi:hypothetical protein